MAEHLAVEPVDFTASAIPMGVGLHSRIATSFADDDLWVKETTEMNLGPDADVLPLCEDLNPGSVGNGDSCWSTCSGQCPNDVLKTGLAFDFDEVGPGHPGCTSHFECVGNKDRVLCHGVRATEELSPAVLAVPSVPVLPCRDAAARRRKAGASTSDWRNDLRREGHLKGLGAGHFL
eukprot:CAMPEP_0197891328 /NCGR_PEP_ID=MMETSP1439-20131203/28102_1 /TAXON_ID=66791 /ORGANISM="Gonyaulax spinifera, Strain CCMP409" /LENGTH=176 /DNA_ID=CAMNT_0043511421 /DNA_START=52 /DNA_END=581 /DNA_ORIENTATION=+